MCFVYSTWKSIILKIEISNLATQFVFSLIASHKYLALYEARKYIWTHHDRTNEFEFYLPIFKTTLINLPKATFSNQMRIPKVPCRDCKFPKSEAMCWIGIYSCNHFVVIIHWHSSSVIFCITQKWIRLLHIL